MKERVMELCKDLCCKEISEEEQLILSGLLDSYKIMELICSLEEEFHITFTPEEISNLDYFSCVKHIVELIKIKEQ